MHGIHPKLSLDYGKATHTVSRSRITTAKFAAFQTISTALMYDPAESNQDSPRTKQGNPVDDGDEPPTVPISSAASSDGVVDGDFSSDIDHAQRFVRHEQLGRGGFGAVYRAYDRKLDRFVAIKVPHINAADWARVQKRVAREATATARLRHPNIVTLFDVVHLDKYSLLINELIEGETLTQLISRHPGGCDFRLAAAVVQRIAQAVQHAHDQSVLHRDIKPSNILLDARAIDGELPFCPRLTDFGLATIIRDDESGDFSQSHSETIGTWHYTPPEVIHNNHDGHTPTCDIYSLGVVLYEMITGTRPFKAVTLADLFIKVRNGDFLPPRSIRSDVPRDLEAICLRCMARSPASRYPTAASLAADLTRFLAGDTVLARMPDPSERFFRSMRRNPTRAAIAAVSAVAILIVFAVIATTNRQLFRLNAKLESMNTDLQTALNTTRKTLYEYEQSNYATDLANASTAIRQSQLRDARTLLSRYTDGQPLSHHRDIEWDHNRFLIAKSPIPIWESDQALYCLSEAGDYYCTAGAASEVVVIDRQTGIPLRSWATGQKEINAVVFDDQNNLIWTSGDDGSIHAYDFKSGAQKHKIQAFQAERAYDIVHFPESSRIACISSFGAVVSVDTTSGKVIGLREKSDIEPTSIAKVDANKLAVGHMHGLLRIFDMLTGKMDREVQADDTFNITSMALDPRKPWLWLLIGNSVRAIDITTMTPLPPHKMSDEAINIAHCATDQSMVITLGGGVFHRYQVTDQAEMIEIDRWVNEGQRIYTTAFDSQSGDLLSVGAAGDVLKWPPPPLALTKFTAQSVGAEDLPLKSFDIVPGTNAGDWPLAIVNLSNNLFQLDTRTVSYTDLGVNAGAYKKFAAIENHCLVLTGSGSSQTIFDQKLKTFTELPLPYSNGNLFALAGNWLADSDYRSNQLRLINLQDHKHAITLPAYNSICACVAERTRQVYWNDGNSLMVRSLDDDAKPTILDTFSRIPSSLQISLDETLLAIGLSDRELYLWDCQENKRVGPTMMHEGSIYAIAFSPHGRTLLTVDESATLRFWNLTTGQQVSQTNLDIIPEKPIHKVKFSADSNFVMILHGQDSLTTIRLR